MRNLTSKSGLMTGLAAAALLVLAGCDQASEEAVTEEIADPIAATEEDSATEGMIEEAILEGEEQLDETLNELETAAGDMMDGAEEAVGEIAGDMMDAGEEIAEEAEEVIEETAEETGGE